MFSHKKKRAKPTFHFLTVFTHHRYNWPDPLKYISTSFIPGRHGAGNEGRTRDLKLGKLALCQLSYARIGPVRTLLSKHNSGNLSRNRGEFVTSKDRKIINTNFFIRLPLAGASVRTGIPNKANDNKLIGRHSNRSRSSFNHARIGPHLVAIQKGASGITIDKPQSD